MYVTVLNNIKHKVSNIKVFQKTRNMIPSPAGERFVCSVCHVVKYSKEGFKKHMLNHTKYNFKLKGIANDKII